MSRNYIYTTQILDRLRDTRTNFELLINRIQPARMTISGVIGRWTVKDILVHILLFEQFLGDTLSDILIANHAEKFSLNNELKAMLIVSSLPEMIPSIPIMHRIAEGKIQKYQSVPLEDIIGLENQAYLILYSFFFNKRTQFLENTHVFRRSIVATRKILEAHSTSITCWLERIH